MDEYISKRALTEALLEIRRAGKLSDTEWVSKAVAVMDEIETLEIVFCRECVSYEISTNNGKPLSYECDSTPPDGFCSRGMRKEDE